MPVAAIALEFDPILRLGDVTVRLQLVVLSLVTVVTLILAALGARRRGLRADDLLFIVVGVVPGAVIGGRVGYVLGHLEHYAAVPNAIIDPGQGSLSLGLAVVGGTLTGAVVARLLGAPLGAWFGTAAVPLLFVLGAGKLAMLAGGSGQGDPSEAPWAVAFVGPGPWGSLAPGLPSHPAQAYEGIATLVILVLVAGLAAGRTLPVDGRLLALAVGLWATVRSAVAVTWRDQQILGPIGAEQAMSMLVAVGSLGLLVLYALRRRARRPMEPASATSPPVEWPDPAGRPPF